MAVVNVYLTFNGNCQEAFDHYKSVFGGEFPYVGKFKDMPSDSEYPIAEEDMEKIMHISLPISKETMLMGSDTSENFGGKAIEGTNFSISVGASNAEEATRIFSELSEGGQVKMPLEKTFWAELFGMFTDRFGIHWMVDYSDPNKTY